MVRSVFSQSWHHAAELKPRLLPHVRIYPHTYRGQLWHVLQDVTGARYHRLSPGAHALVARMDGMKTVQALWDEACLYGGESIPTQDEVVELLMQLHANDLLHCDVTPDAAELVERYSKRRRQKWLQWLTNPLSLRIPLLDPDRFLTRWAQRLAWVFGVRGALLWLAVVLPAFVLAAQHWRELSENLPDRTLTSGNLLLMALVFPVVKALHELGHGFATKVGGGAVHEMGLMFLVFAPTPYVDASAASAFRSKYQRAVVGAAGMLVELFLAALAMFVWLLVEPGVVRALAFNVMLIAGVSTVVVNGNPLLRYDGYYILSDLIEMPNLAQRGQRYLTYLCDRYLFGARELEASHETAAEKRWLVTYAIASWCYRILVTLAVIMFIAGEFFIFGVLLALWGALGLFGMPLWKAAAHVLHSSSLARHRRRAQNISVALLAGFVLLISVVPMPQRTLAEGVVWLPDQAMLRAGAGGTFQRWLVAPGTAVQRGTPLLVMDDPMLAAELAVARAKVTAAQARYLADQFTNPVQAEVERQQLAYEQRALEQADERNARLIVSSEIDGVLTVPNAQDMEGRHFKKGELLGYLLNGKQLLARVVVTQDNIDLVRSQFHHAELRFADAIPQRFPVTLLRVQPGASEELPSAALGLNGGGQVAVDPKDANGLKVLERVFLVDLGLPAQAQSDNFGGRVYVRFEHDAQPLLFQWWRRVRQLFLSHFHV